MKIDLLVPSLIATALIFPLAHPAHGASKTPKAKPAPTPAPAITPSAEAVKKYPELAKQGSTFNAEFVERVNRYKTEKPDFFKDPTWPMKLADEVAASPTIVRAVPGAIRLDDLFDHTIAEVQHLLGKPVGKKADFYGDELVEYRPTGFDYVKVLPRGEKEKRIKWIMIKVPEFTGNNITTSWEKLLTKIGVGAGGVTTLVGGSGNRLFNFCNARIGRLILTGDRADMGKRNPSYERSDPYSLFFDMKDNELMLWGGN